MWRQLIEVARPSSVKTMKPSKRWRIMRVSRARSLGQNEQKTAQILVKDLADYTPEDYYRT